jgi:hypothetical protein
MDTYSQQPLFAVYAISGASTVSLYIGATTRLDKRLDEHLSALAHDRHYNQSLQSDWNTFGATHFAFITLQFLKSAEQVRDAEKMWIEYFHKENRPLYNRPLGGYNAKDYVFLSPAGERVEAHGLRELCEANHLTISNLARVARGEDKQHKGWTLFPINSGAFCDR